MLWIKRLTKLLAFIVLILIFFVLLCFRSDISREDMEVKYNTPESHYITIDDQKIHVRLKGKGEPVVLLHGSFSSLHTWDAWQQELSPYFLTVAIDFPGHGLSVPDELKRYSQMDYASLVLRLMERLNLDKFHLAGNSMGGGVALQIASTRPDKVLSLNLIDSSGAPSDRSLDDESNQNQSGARWIFKLIQNPVFSQFFLKCTPKFLFQMNLKEVYSDSKKITTQTVDRYYDLMLVEGNRQATFDRLQGRKESDIDFSRITMPTLIMWGKKDLWIPMQHAYLLENAISDAHLVTFDHVGHVPMEEIPTESVSEYLSFLGVEVRREYFGSPKLLTHAD